MSSNIHDMTERDRSLEELRALQNLVHSPHHGGGDGPGGDDMQARIDKLDRQMDGVHKDLSDIKVALSRIEAKLDTKPGHWAVIGLNATLLGLVLAAIGFGARIL